MSDVNTFYSLLGVSIVELFDGYETAYACILSTPFWEFREGLGKEMAEAIADAVVNLSTPFWEFRC